MSTHRVVPRRSPRWGYDSYTNNKVTTVALRTGWHAAHVTLLCTNQLNGCLACVHCFFACYSFDLFQQLKHATHSTTQYLIQNSSNRAVVAEWRHKLVGQRRSAPDAALLNWTNKAQFFLISGSQFFFSANKKVAYSWAPQGYLSCSSQVKSG